MSPLDEPLTFPLFILAGLGVFRLIDVLIGLVQRLQNLWWQRQFTRRLRLLRQHQTTLHSPDEFRWKMRYEEPSSQATEQEVAERRGNNTSSVASSPASQGGTVTPSPREGTSDLPSFIRRRGRRPEAETGPTLTSKEST